MTDQSHITTESSSAVLESTTGLVEAQVIGASASYFKTEKVLNSDGQPRKDAQGNEIIVERRFEALRGAVIEVSQFEFDRLADAGIVRVPSDAPLMPPRVATPFGVPMEDDDGVLRAYAGPIMGDPNPTAEDTPNHAVISGPKPLTPEEAAALEAQAQGKAPSDAFDPGEATAEEIQEHIDENDLNADQTLALAKVDGEYDPVLADRVLEAELSREKPRSSVTNPLEKVE